MLNAVLAVFRPLYLQGTLGNGPTERSIERASNWSISPAEQLSWTEQASDLTSSSFSSSIIFQVIFHQLPGCLPSSSWLFSIAIKVPSYDLLIKLSDHSWLHLTPPGHLPSSSGHLPSLEGHLPISFRLSYINIEVLRDWVIDSLIELSDHSWLHLTTSRLLLVIFHCIQVIFQVIFPYQGSIELLSHCSSWVTASPPQYLLGGTLTLKLSFRSYTFFR